MNKYTTSSQNNKEQQEKKHSDTIDNYVSATFLKCGVNPKCHPSIMLNSPQDPQITQGLRCNVIDPTPDEIRDFIGGWLGMVYFMVEGRKMVVYFDDNGIGKGLTPNIAFAQMYGSDFCEQHNTFLLGNVVVMTDIYHEKYQKIYE